MDIEQKQLIKEAQYDFTNGRYKVQLSVDFTRQQYTLYTKNNSLDFVFLDSDPYRCSHILSLMLAATEYAKKVLHEDEPTVECGETTINHNITFSTKRSSGRDRLFRDCDSSHGN